MDERVSVAAFIEQYCTTKPLLHWQKRIVEQVAEGKGVCLPHVKGSGRFLDELHLQYEVWRSDR